MGGRMRGNCFVGELSSFLVGHNILSFAQAALEVLPWLRRAGGSASPRFSGRLFLRLNTSSEY